MKTYSDISEVLRRDDPWRRGSYDTESVELVEVEGNEHSCQAVRTVDDYDGHTGVAVYSYVPLAFGPVRL